MRNIFLILAGLVCSCNDATERNKELWEMMRSDNIGKVVSAIDEIKDNRDTTMVGALLFKMDDPRLLHSSLHKGQSIYQLKMEALQEITGVEPPNKITDEVDKTNIDFYLVRFSHSK